MYSTLFSILIIPTIMLLGFILDILVSRTPTVRRKKNKKGLGRLKGFSYRSPYAKK